MVDGVLAGSHGREPGVEGEVLDQTRDAAAVLEDLADGGRFEDAGGGTGGLEVTIEKESKLLFVEGGEV